VTIFDHHGDLAYALPEGTHRREEDRPCCRPASSGSASTHLPLCRGPPRGSISSSGSQDFLSRSSRRRNSAYSVGAAADASLCCAKICGSVAHPRYRAGRPVGRTAAERIGSPLSVNVLREDLQVAFDTVKGWLATLERLYFLFELRPFSGRLARTLRREGKIYLFDHTEIEDPGARFENLVALHLLKLVDCWNDLGTATSRSGTSATRRSVRSIFWSLTGANHSCWSRPSSRTASRGPPCATSPSACRPLGDSGRAARCPAPGSCPRSARRAFSDVDVSPRLGMRSVSLVLRAPGDQDAFHSSQTDVHQLADHADGDHAGDHEIGTGHLAAVDDDVAHAALGGDQLGGHHAHPGVAQADAQAGDYGGQGARQHHPADELPARGLKTKRFDPDSVAVLVALTGRSSRAK